eukprot:5200272-Amphidinium_carterae.2
MASSGRNRQAGICQSCFGVPYFLVYVALFGQWILQTLFHTLGCDGYWLLPHTLDTMSDIDSVHPPHGPVFSALLGPPPEECPPGPSHDPAKEYPPRLEVPFYLRLALRTRGLPIKMTSFCCKFCIYLVQPIPTGELNPCLVLSVSRVHCH